MMKIKYHIPIILVLGILASCKEETKEMDPFIWIPLEVTATAYNSFKYQTSKNPSVTAWGDTLRPGMKSIAVSRNLISKGLKHNTMVRIDAFPDTFYVKDKMHRRWQDRIDIYMGKDIKLAREWGRQKVCIEYAVLKTSLDSLSQIDKK